MSWATLSKKQKHIPSVGAKSSRTGSASRAEASEPNNYCEREPDRQVQQLTGILVLLRRASFISVALLGLQSGVSL